MKPTILIGAILASALADIAVTQIVTETFDSSHQLNMDASGLASKMALEALRDDWDKFDKSTGIETQDLMAVTVHPQWVEQITPPFPNVWPPAKARTISYYAYAQYGVALSHGPTISYSAPWARVVRRDGSEPIKEIYRTSIGEVVWSRVSEMWSAEHARKYNEIQRSGEREIPAFCPGPECPQKATQLCGQSAITTASGSSIWAH